MIAIAFICINEEIGRKQLIRIIHNFVQYGDNTVKKYIPIMLTVLGIHAFTIQTTDLLYKMAHLEDKETAYRSILGLGLISAGTNNSRVSSLLKNLSLYYEED